MTTEYRIGDLCSFTKGASVPRDRMKDQGLLYLHYGDLYTGHNLYIDVENPEKPLPSIDLAEKLRSDQFVDNGDIVYVLTSETVEDLGKSLYLSNPKHRTVVAGTETTIMRVGRQDIVEPRYLNYLLQTPRFQRKLRQYVTGMKVFRVHPRDIARITISVPSLAEQKKIITLLDSIYFKIRLNQRINDHLEKLLLSQYDAMFDVGETAKSRGRLSDIGTIVGGATPSKKKLEDYFCTDGIGWITPRDLANTDNKFIAHGALDITREGFDSCSVKALPAGSVLFSSRAPIGYIAIASDELTTNQGFKSIVPRAEIGTAFTYCLLVRNKQRIADAGSGTTFPEVSANTMANIEISLPSESLCQEFSSWAQPVLKLQSRIEEESHLLRIARDALLPRLMSGEVDVSRIDLRQLNGHLSES